MLRIRRALAPILIAAAFISALAIACTSDDEEVAPDPAAQATAAAPAEPIRIVTSTGIIGHLAEQVAGDAAVVYSVIPAGADVHSFSATTGDIREIAEADVVIVNGYNLEESTLATIFEHTPEGAKIIVAMAGIEPLEGGHGHHGHEDEHGHMDEDEHGHEDEDEHGHEDEDEHGHEDGDDDAHEDKDDDAHEDKDDHAHEDGDDDAHEDEDDHAHEDEDDHAHEDEDDHADEDGHDDAHEDEDDHGHMDEHGHDVKAPAGAELAIADGDPHAWLSVPHVMVYVRNIADGLAEADPDNAAGYRERAEAYLAVLQDLDDEVRAAIESIPQERRVLIVYHDAFQYFAVEYGLELAAAVLPGNPSQQASAAAVAEIIEVVAGRDVGAVYREPQFAADALEAIAEEAGVEVLVLYSGAFAGEVNTYVDLMRWNAQSLVEGLGGG